MTTCKEFLALPRGEDICGQLEAAGYSVEHTSPSGLTVRLMRNGKFATLKCKNPRECLDWLLKVRARCRKVVFRLETPTLPAILPCWNCGEVPELDTNYGGEWCISHCFDADHDGEGYCNATPYAAESTRRKTIERWNEIVLEETEELVDIPPANAEPPIAQIVDLFEALKRSLEKTESSK